MNLLLMRDRLFLQWVFSSLGAFAIAGLCLMSALRPVQTVVPVVPGHTHSVAVQRSSDDSPLLMLLTIGLGVAGAFGTYKAADRGLALCQALEVAVLRRRQELQAQALAAPQPAAPALQPLPQPEPEPVAVPADEPRFPIKREPLPPLPELKPHDRRSVPDSIADDPWGELPSEENEPGNALDRFSEPEDAWIDRLIAPSSLLVFGGDGSGKTTFALELLRRREKAGHSRIALDPHSHPGKWPGCKVVGGGLKFSEIAVEIDKLQKLIKYRYEKISAGEVKPGEFPPVTVVCEEMTVWKALVGNSGLLIWKMGDYRKANIHLLMVAHGNTMSQIGAPDGSHEVIKNCMTQVRLLSRPDSDGRPVPAMKGSVQYPLQEWLSVTVPEFAPVETPPDDTYAIFKARVKKLQDEGRL